MWQTVLRSAGPQAVAQLAAAEQGQRQAEAAYTAAQQASAQYEAATKNPWDGTYERPMAGLDPLAVDLVQRYGTQGLQFVTNKGNPASIKESEIGKKGATETSTGFVPLDPNAQYRFINEKGKDRVLYTGAGEEGLKNVYAMAQDLSATKGKKANWGVEMLDPATGQWSRVADDDPAKKWTSVVGDVLGAALPLAVQLIPGVGQLGTLAQIGLSAAAGGAGAGLAGKNVLKGAVMGGLSSAGGQLLGPAIQGVKVPVPGVPGAFTKVATNLGASVGTGLGTVAGGLATGQKLQNALLGGVAAGGLRYAGGELLGPKTPSADGTLVGKDVSGIAADTLAKEAAQGLGGSIGQQVGGSLGQQVAGGLGDLVVEAARKGLYNPAGVSSAIGSTAGNLLRQELSKTSPEAENEQLVVTAKEKPPVNLGAGVAGALPSVLPSSPTPPKTSPEAEDEQLVVTAKPRTPPSIVPGLSSIVSQLPSGAGQTPAAQPEKPLDENSTLDDIVNYLRLGGLGLGLIGDLVGGGGGSTGTNRVPAGLFGGSRSPVFGSTLPAPNMPGLASTAGPRTAADLGGQGLASPQDYYRYGYGPEQSFRSNIAAAPRNTSTAYTGYAEGGYAVGGPGDGRDDKIPAMLSDGEYVIDAETVAMLGNGSTKAGADALDNFRVNIRKHKGRALSKGEFSDNAKKPEQYLKKGRR